MSGDLMEMIEALVREHYGTQGLDYLRQRCSQQVAAGLPEPFGWFTEDYLIDKSATTYDKEVADRWLAKGWPVSPLFAEPAASHGVKPMSLRWRNKGRHVIYRTDGCMFAQFGDLEHSTGPAGFEVYLSNDGWECCFWHGNKGHTVCRPQAFRWQAQTAGQKHADKLLASILLVAKPDRQQDDEEAAYCNYPDCSCPFDHPGTEDWCARGLPQGDKN